ncbi:MAG TPA: YceI family protein [Cyclobacteriaceae bacterium]|jgi:polyisoprenoid-binding protein YceI|nr:YceI family protein [Cyclobacteriaceae bacterium]
MKKLNFLSVFVLLAGTAVGQTNWTIDKAHSKIGFNVTHMVVSEVEGYFKDYDAKIASTADDFNGATIEFTAKAASVFTDNEYRDAHLRGENNREDDFFGVAKYPEIKFAGTLVKEGGKYVLKGNLTMKDVTKPVELEVAYGGRVKTANQRNPNGEKAGFKIKGKINRKDFGLKFASKLQDGAMVVSDEVTLDIKIELNKA